MVQAHLSVISAATQRQIQRTVAVNEELLRIGGLLNDEIPAEVASTHPERALKATDRYAAEISLAKKNKA